MVCPSALIVLADSHGSPLPGDGTVRQATDDGGNALRGGRELP